MANRPTIAQQQLLEHVLEEISNTALTRSALMELTPAQRNKVLENRKLQNVLLQAQTSEELKAGFSNIKWALINNPRYLLLSAGCKDVWSATPFSWLDCIKPNEISANIRPPLDNSNQPNFEPIWLVHYTIAHTNYDKDNLNNFINHLALQGITGDTQLTSVAFGGKERLLKLHDIIVAYAPNTQVLNWGPITNKTTWKTEDEVEDTLFSIFLNVDKVEASESEKILKRLPALKINWEKNFAVNVFQTRPNYSMSLATLVCAKCLISSPSTKNLKKFYLSALEFVASLDPTEQKQIIEDILQLTGGYRNHGGMKGFMEASKQMVTSLSPAVQKMWASTLIAEFVKTMTSDFKQYMDVLLRVFPQKKQFDVEHLQAMYKNMDRLFEMSRYSPTQSKGMDLFKLWKSLRPYMTDNALDIVDQHSSGLLELFTHSDVKQWKSNFNLHVNIKPQLLNQTLTSTTRKM